MWRGHVNQQSMGIACEGTIGENLFSWIRFEALDVAEDSDEEEWMPNTTSQSDTSSTALLASSMQNPLAIKVSAPGRRSKAKMALRASQKTTMSKATEGINRYKLIVQIFEVEQITAWAQHLKNATY